MNQSERKFLTISLLTLQIWSLRAKHFCLQFLVNILPLGSGSRKPNCCGSYGHWFKPRPNCSEPGPIPKPVFRIRPDPMDPEHFGTLVPETDPRIRFQGEKIQPKTVKKREIIKKPVWFLKFKQKNNLKLLSVNF